MTARELLDTLRVLGVAVWLEDGRIRFFAPDATSVPHEVRQAIRQQAQALAGIIREEYVCWRCDSRDIRFDLQLRRYVCEHCRRILSDPLDAFPPLPELLLQAGAVYGYPELHILPHITLPAGREAWTRFCTAPFTPEHERLLIAAYRRLLHPQEVVEIDSAITDAIKQNHEAKEVKDMRIRWTASEPLPTGEYPVKVESVTEQEGKFGVQLVWKLRVLDPEHEGKELTAWTNTSSSTNSKLARWASALGFEPEIGEELDTEELKGRKAIAVVVVKRAEDGNLFNRVDDLLPFKKSAKAQQVRVKHGMVAVPATSAGFYEMADDEDPDDPFNQ